MISPLPWHRKTQEKPDGTRLLGQGVAPEGKTGAEGGEEDVPKTKKALISQGFSLVGLVGLEPMTPTMSTWCSNQLSYNPKRGTKRIIA